MTEVNNLEAVISKPEYRYSLEHIKTVPRSATKPYTNLRLFGQAIRHKTGNSTSVEILRRLFKDLELLGFGTLQRYDKEFKFEWKPGYSLGGLRKSVEAILPPSEIVTLDSTSPTTVNLEQVIGHRNVEIESKVISHRFHIRPGIEVTFALPVDITPKEASRLQNFINALPFTGE
jgi:hypothetical protein